MKKYFYIIIFLKLLYLINNQQCDNRYYGNDGESCGAPGRLCKYFYTCRSGKCTYGQIGAQCDKREDCFRYQEENLICLNSKCTKQKYSGWSCSSDGECWSGKCVTGVCVGKGENVGCNPNNNAECDYGLYCSFYQGKCLKQKQALDRCNDYAWEWDPIQGKNYNIICPGGYVCFGQNGTETCRPFRVGLEGTGCFFQRDGNLGCNFGLTCDQSRNICVKEQEPVFSCPTGPCPFGQRCICDPPTQNITGTCKLRTNRIKCDLNKYLNLYRQCAYDNNCNYEKNFADSWLTDSLDQGTCMGYSCSQIAKEYLCCAYTPFRREKYSPVSSGALKCPQPQQDNALGTLIVLSLLFIVGIIGCITAAIIGSLIFFYKKGDEIEKYQSLK